MKKVGFFATTLNSGGLENYLLRFLQFYNGAFTSVIICKGGEFGDLQEQFNNIDNIELVQLQKGYINPIRFWELLQLFRKERFDSICDFTGNFAGLIVLAAKMLGVKKRITFYRGSTNHFKETPLRLLYNKILNRLVYQSSTCILSNSKTAFNFFFKDSGWENKKKFEVIYNGIDCQAFSSKINQKDARKKIGVPIGAFIIGNVGRYNAAKNHKTMLKVALAISKKHENVYFIFCGKDTDTIIKQQIKDYPWAKDRIIGLGLRPDIPDILRTLDLFFFPSVTEGQPNALIEAMVSGIPILSSNIDSIKETVPPYYYSQLIGPNDIDAFISRIELFLRDRTLLAEHNHKDWASKQFDHKELYQKFRNKL